jgi:hypothetical protein
MIIYTDIKESGEIFFAVVYKNSDAFRNNSVAFTLKILHRNFALRGSKKDSKMNFSARI